MSSIHEAPVFQVVYDLLKDVHIARGKFEKTEKYSLGEQLELQLLELLLNIISAGHAKRTWKITSIDKALLAGEKTKILMRLAYDLEQINQGRYLKWQEAIQKIGRMLGGWKKSL
ncbi:four helix bundle protein [Candidatus Uhrbacteria bacterium]|nr:four helix bundle protein [Candidatus Uhrbacteria bacterium]